MSEMLQDEWVDRVLAEVRRRGMAEEACWWLVVGKRRRASSVGWLNAFVVVTKACTEAEAAIQVLAAKNTPDWHTPPNRGDWERLSIRRVISLAGLSSQNKDFVKTYGDDVVD